MIQGLFGLLDHPISATTRKFCIDGHIPEDGGQPNSVATRASAPLLEAQMLCFGVW